MKYSILYLGSLFLILTSSCHRIDDEMNQSVNSIIGDISHVLMFSEMPNKETDENLRLQTHLYYVESELRKRDIYFLTFEQKENRKMVLDLLNGYWKSAEFPRNYDYPNQRKPCFIDKTGNICAVGYLIEQTEGRAIAEKLNQKHQYDYILDIENQLLKNWTKKYGLTIEECAMIQPTYQPVNQEANQNNLSPAYGISSALFSGFNLSMNTINAIQISNGTNRKTASTLGVLGGIGQITLGIVNYPEEQELLNGNYINTAERNMSLINIGLGTSALIMSSWNLITNRKPKEKSMSWNVHSFPTRDNNMGVALSLTKRL